MLTLEVSSNYGPSSLEELLEERTDSPFISIMWAVDLRMKSFNFKKSVQIYKIKLLWVVYYSHLLTTHDQVPIQSTVDIVMSLVQVWQSRFICLQVTLELNDLEKIKILQHFRFLICEDVSIITELNKLF